VLVVRFSSIGDVLLTTPLLRAIRQRHPGAHLTVLTKTAYAPLLTDNPRLDRVIAIGPGEALPALAARLRADRFTHLLDLHQSLRSRALRVLVPGSWSTYPKHRMARSLLIHTKRDRYRARRSVAERYFAAARGLDVRPDGAPPEFFFGSDVELEAERWLAQDGMTHEAYVAAAPGAAHATKRWPLNQWRALLARLDARGVPVVLVGGDGDATMAEALRAERPGRTRTAAGRAGLQLTGALLKRAAVVVSGDTGAMHMASGVGTPVVALFGPTVEAFGFFPYTPLAQVLQRDLECRPCSSQGGPRCPLAHHRCMADISPDEVAAAVTRWLP